MSPYKSDHGVIAMEIIISQEIRGPGNWKLNTELLKDKDLQTKIKEELKLIKRTYALTPYEQNNLEANELNIEYSIKPDIMWELMLVEIRGIIIAFAKKKIEHRREKEIIKEITKLENRVEKNTMIDIEHLEVLNLDLERIRKDKIKGAQIRARSLKLNEGEKPSSYFLSLEKANYINKTILEIYNIKNNLIKDREGILNAQKSFYQKLYSKGNTTTLDRSPLNWVTQYIQRIPNKN